MSECTAVNPVTHHLCDLTASHAGPHEWLPYRAFYPPGTVAEERWDDVRL